MVIAFDDLYTIMLFKSCSKGFFSDFEFYEVHCISNDSCFSYKEIFMTTGILQYL